jgi:hypothetical protein
VSAAKAPAGGAKTKIVEKNKGYESLSRAVLQDERLSYRARGVLAAILSRPSGWRTSAEQLAKQGKEGREAIRAALKELETVGYLGRARVQDGETGLWGWVWIVGQDPETVAEALAEEVRSRLRAVPDSE